MSLSSRRMSHRITVVMAVLVSAALGAVTAQAQPGFSDQTAAAGLTFVFAPAPDTPGLPMHGGGAVGDFNNDGWPDLFVVGGGLTRDRLFMNNGDGTFTDRAVQNGLTLLYRGNGASAADYDNDGDLDIYVTSFGDMSGPPTNGQHKLWRNDNGHFTDVAVAARVNSTGTTPDGYGVAWGDYDLDGDMDLFVGCWHADPDGVSRDCKLFRNNLIPLGTRAFGDVTGQLGLFTKSAQGFGAVFADMDGDRFPELLVAGDFGTSRYYANTRHGGFTQPIILSEGDTKVWNGMGTTIGDFNRDGRFDWFVAAIYPAWEDAGPPGNRLYMNQGDNQFVSLPEAAGVNDGGWGWGTAAIDFNHDGWQDIVQTNGWPTCPDPVTGECFVNEPTYLFQNTRDPVNTSFVEVAQSLGLDDRMEGRGLVTFDYDRDGDLDIVIFSNPVQGPGDPPDTGNLKLFRNEICGAPAHPGGCSSGGNYLEVVLDPSANPALSPNGWGSDVTVLRGTALQHFRLAGGGSYLSGSQLLAHFGVGGTTVLDEVTVYWSDGFQTVRKNVPTNQILTIAAPVPLTHAPFVRGTAAELKVIGLQPGETAYFLATSKGVGAGPCNPAMDALCTNLLSPHLLGTSTADADGTATWTLDIPPSAPVGAKLYIQVMVQRGLNGVKSLKSNVSEGAVEAP